MAASEIAEGAPLLDLHHKPVGLLRFEILGGKNFDAVVQEQRAANRRAAELKQLTKLADGEASNIPPKKSAGGGKGRGRGRGRGKETPE
eukprot:9205125-Pyramimonas_sp.AAC.1